MGLEEALAINYLGQLQGDVAANINYVWAWIAYVAAAAISFWKIKFSSSSAVHSSLMHQAAVEEHEASLTSNTINIISAFGSMENRRSGKFSIYYYDDCQSKLAVDEHEEEEEEEKQELLATSKYFQGWEWEPKMKTTEMVWYRYQDLAVLNGNVVRLWN